MAVSARAGFAPSRFGESAVRLEESTLGRVKSVCDFVNAEVARLRNQTIAIALFALVGAIVFPLVTGIGDPRIPLLLAAGIIGIAILRARNELASSCRNIAAKRMVAAMSRSLSYRPKSTMTQKQFLAMDLFSGHVFGWKTGYEMAGNARGIRFGLHRVTATGRNSSEVVFDGVIIKVDFSQAFPGHTIVVPDKLEGGSHGSRVKRDLVLLKHPAFEQRFSVYSSDYFEARRLVTPKLMGAAIEAVEKVGGDIRMAFVQRSLFVAARGEALDVNATLFSGPLTPQAAVGKATHLVVFAERLALALAE
jgi:hypothetical protein